MIQITAEACHLGLDVCNPQDNELSAKAAYLQFELLEAVDTGNNRSRMLYSFLGLCDEVLKK